MARGADHRIAPDRNTLVYLDRSRVARRSEKKETRLGVPAIGRKCVKWLVEGATLKVLVELADPGCIILRPWSPYGEWVVEELAAIDVDEDVGRHERGLLVAAGIRFVRSSIQSGERLILNARMEEHLEILPGSAPEMFVLCTFDRIEIWNRSHYASVLERMGHEIKNHFPWAGAQY